MTNFAEADNCMKENCDILGNPDGTVKPGNEVMWNLNSILYTVCQSLKEIERELKRLKS